MSNSQDIRTIGGLCLRIPLTSSFFNIANLALCGAPFLAGYYSKDLILEASSFSYINYFIYFIFFFSTGLTVRYSFRLIYYSIVGDFNRSALHSINDERWVILKRMGGLIFISIVRGSLLRWLIFPSPFIICLPYQIKFLTFLVCIIGGSIGYLTSRVALYFFNKSLSNTKIIRFFSIIWFMPFISSIWVIKFPLKFGGEIKLLDQGWRERIGSNKLLSFIKLYTQFYQIFHINSIKLYLLRFFFYG